MLSIIVQEVIDNLSISVETDLNIATKLFVISPNLYTVLIRTKEIVGCRIFP